MGHEDHEDSQHVQCPIDLRDEGGAVEVEEFLLGCLRLRGQARAMDMASYLHL